MGLTRPALPVLGLAPLGRHEHEVEQAPAEPPDLDGHGRLELRKFHTPSNRDDNRHTPANTPGIRHVAFAVEDIDAVVAGLRACGAELVGELKRYEDSYRSAAAPSAPAGGGHDPLGQPLAHAGEDAGQPAAWSCRSGPKPAAQRGLHETGSSLDAVLLAGERAGVLGVP